jgi:hypothetical protein
LFIVNGISAMQMENLSRRGAKREAYLVKRKTGESREAARGMFNGEC